MSQNIVKRVYVSKKDKFDYASIAVKDEIKEILGIELKKFKIYRRYDMEISDEVLNSILYTILAEKPVDEIYTKDRATVLEDGFEQSICSIYLPGQYDQRKQGLLDTIALLSDENIKARVSVVYEISGASDEELKAIEKLLINPVDSLKIDIKNIPTFQKNTQKKFRKYCI